MEHPSTWDGLMELVASQPAPPSDPTKDRLSSLPYKKYCTEMENGPAGYHATRGRAMHYCVEHQHIPFDIPEAEQQELNLAFQSLKQLADEGWMVMAKELHLLNHRLSGNLDLVLTWNDNAIAYVDWKFGSKEVDVESPQLVGGVELLMEHYPDYEHYYTGVIQPFTINFKGSVPMREWSIEEVQERVTQYTKKKSNMSSSCGYCIKWIDGSCPSFNSTLAGIRALEIK